MVSLNVIYLHLYKFKVHELSNIYITILLRGPIINIQKKKQICIALRRHLGSLCSMHGCCMWFFFFLSFCLVLNIVIRCYSSLCLKKQFWIVCHLTFHVEELSNEHRSWCCYWDTDRMVELASSCVVLNRGKAEGRIDEVGFSFVYMCTLRR